MATLPEVSILPILNRCCTSRQNSRWAAVVGRGILVLREVEQRLRVADRLTACMVDPRAPELITHTLAEIIRFRLLMIGAGYEDGNDARVLCAAIRSSKWRSIYRRRIANCV